MVTATRVVVVSSELLVNGARGRRGKSARKGALSLSFLLAIRSLVVVVVMRSRRWGCMVAGTSVSLGMLLGFDPQRVLI